jgi:hypothetical protein
MRSESTLKKYGKLHTVFGLEVEKALNEYLKSRKRWRQEKTKKDSFQKHFRR